MLFWHFFDFMAKNKGKFIVIEGTDGSGKATQAKLLYDKLTQMGHKVEPADFPQYGKKSAGLVENYLNEKYGSSSEVGPYRASIFYACDRYDASFQIKKWLASGCVVVADRYVGSNMAHQGGKIKGELEKKAFFDWVYDLEYNLFELPKPDINIILHVETDVTQNLINQRNYLEADKKDMHEKDLDHLREAEKNYLFMASALPDFLLIKCTENNQILNREIIHKQIWHKVESLLHSTNNKPNQILVKKIHTDAILPTWNHDNNAVLNIFSSEHITLLPEKHNIIKTGVKIKIPQKYIAFIHGLANLDTEGIYVMPRMLDSNFSDEINISILNLSNDYYHIQAGQKIAQIIIQKLHQPNNI